MKLHKKVLALTLACMMALTLLAGCGGNSAENNTANNGGNAANSNGETQEENTGSESVNIVWAG